MKKPEWYNPNMQAGSYPAYAFSFKDKNQKNIIYWATYDSRKKSLNITKHDIQEMEDKPVAETESWAIFDTHATLIEILEAAVAPSLCYLHDEALEALEVIRNSENKDVTLLETIRDKSFILHKLDFDLMGRFVNIIETARWSVNDEERENATNLLKRYLIPMRGCGKHPLPPEFNVLALLLMRKLADFLSKKCRKALKEVGGYKEATSTVDWKESWEFLKEKFSAGDTADIRISRLTLKEMKLLVKNPAKFSENNFFIKAGMTTETLQKLLPGEGFFI